MVVWATSKASKENQSNNEQYVKDKEAGIYKINLATAQTPPIMTILHTPPQAILELLLLSGQKS